jgi:hypothetical protein
MRFASRSLARKIHPESVTGGFVEERKWSTCIDECPDTPPPSSEPKSNRDGRSENRDRWPNRRLEEILSPIREGYETGLRASRRLPSS